MGYQSQSRSHRDSGRGRGIPRHKKAKTRLNVQKQRSDYRYAVEQEPVTSFNEVLERTVNVLRNLGKQVFALPPFAEHFDRWLTDVRFVLSEFESNPAVSLEEGFAEERSRVLSYAENELDRKRREEAQRAEVVRSLSDSNVQLERMEEEYDATMKEIESSFNDEIKRLSSSVDSQREELDRVAQMRAGLFRSLSKKAKEQKEEETRRRLDSARAELASATQNLNAKKATAKAQYEEKKQSVIENITEKQKEVERQEIDGSIEARRAACDALIEAVSKFSKSKSPPET